MAPEDENTEELDLARVDAAIKAVKAGDFDINPFTVARELEIKPEVLFESKEFMGRVIEARRKSQGDSATFSYDSELALRLADVEAELLKVIEINQDLYDRGSALEEQVISLESKVTDLEQEAETLAMQLQNSWHLGYNKGLADGQQRPKDEAVSSDTGSGEQIGHVTVDHEPIMLEGEELHSSENLPPEPQEDLEEERETPPEAPPEVDTETVRIEEENEDQAAYNERVYNAVPGSLIANSGKENYGNFSWKEIETVYQYSTVAGRPNINLYFEPFASGPPGEVDELVDEEDDAAANSRTGPLPTFQKSSREEVESMLAANQNETQPIPGAAAYFQAKEAAENAAEKAANKGYIRADDLPDNGNHDSPRSYFEDFETNSLTGNSLTGNSLTGSYYHGPSEVDLHDEEGPTEESMGEAAAEILREPEHPQATATYDGLDALKPEQIRDESGDELDLDKLDIFADLEDIEELSQIEVIEDVVLPPQQDDKAVSNDDLRELIKNRIKKADESQTLQALQPPGPTSTGTHAAQSPTATGQHAAQQPPAEGEAQDYGKIDADALKAGVRNKFVGGKAAPPAPAKSAGAATGGTGESESTGSGGGGHGAPGPAPRVVPPDIRKHCMILGVRPEDLTVKVVVDAWKREMSQPGVHPDTGGDTETAIYLNNAKVELVKWIEAQAPKLGKKFGGQSAKPSQESGKPFIMGAGAGAKKDADKKEPDKKR